MFKNRELSIRLQKPDRREEDLDPRNEKTIFEDKVALVHYVIKNVVKTVVIGVVVYVVADTARQVVVSQATQ